MSSNLIRHSGIFSLQLTKAGLSVAARSCLDDAGGLLNINRERAARMTRGFCSP
jgi:hypothetical protein